MLFVVVGVLIPTVVAYTASSERKITNVHYIKMFHFAISTLSS